MEPMDSYHLDRGFSEDIVLDMPEHTLRQLEAAAQVVLAPPNLISAEQRQSAETVFLQYRKRYAPYHLCRYIMEKSTVDYVLFETAGLINIAVVREWPQLQSSDVQSLIEYLQHYVISRPTLAPFVRAKILQDIAILIKLITSRDSGEERKKVLDLVESLIRHGDFSQRILGCNLLSAILQEYASNVKSSNISQTLEWHIKEKMEFDHTVMQQIFKFCVQMLAELMEKLMEEEILSLLKHLLAIAETMFFWQSSKCSCHRFKIENRYGDDYAVLDLPSTRSWRDIILDPIVLNVFFTVYLKIHNNLQIAHHAMNCLVQLAAVPSSFMIEPGTKETYLRDYIKNFLKLVTNIDINSQEAIGISNIIKRININFRNSLHLIPKSLYASYIQEITRLTCLFIDSIIQEEKICTDDPLYPDAVEQMLGVLSTYHQNTSYETNNETISFSGIFHSYVQYRLSPRHENTELYGKGEYKKEIAEVEENDRVKFNNQLAIISIFARNTTSHSLSLLTELLEKRIQKLCDNLNVLIGQNNSFSRPDSMDELYEELHWLILIIGHVLCIDLDEKIIEIPLEIALSSMNQFQNGQVDVHLTLEFLMSSQNVQLDLNRPICSVDQIVRLIADVFRLCAIEKTLISLHLENILSPELSCTLTWFLCRISRSYLLPQKSDHIRKSTIILKIFGDGGPSATWTMNFLLDKVVHNINAFKSEPAIIEETLNLLLSLASSTTKSFYVCKSEQIKYVMDLIMKGQHDYPQIIKRGLMRAMVEIGGMLQKIYLEYKCDTHDRCFWLRTLEFMQRKYTQLISSDIFMSSYHQEEIKIQIIDMLEVFIGAAEGAQSPVINDVHQTIYPVLAAGPKLLSLYHNYQDIVQLILELLCKYMKHNIEQSLRVKLLDICLETIQTYVRCNSNRFTVDPTAEEDNYHDILLLMQLLVVIVDNASDMIALSDMDLPDDDEESLPDEAEDQTVLACTKSFFSSLNLIMPLIRMDLLKFPSLCLQYFTMISCVCRVRPDKVCSLPMERLQQLLVSVELGIHSLGYDAVDLCCDILVLLAEHIYSTAEERNERCNDVLLPFLNLFISLVISNQINSDLISTLSGPFYYLLCCYNEQYKELVKNIIQKHMNNITLLTRLSESFTMLTHNVILNGQRIHMINFQSKFDQFAKQIRGFLMIK